MPKFVLTCQTFDISKPTTDPETGVVNYPVEDTHVVTFICDELSDIYSKFDNFLRGCGFIVEVDPSSENVLSGQTKLPGLEKEPISLDGGIPEDH